MAELPFTGVPVMRAYSTSPPMSSATAKTVAEVAGVWSAGRQVKNPVLDWKKSRLMSPLPAVSWDHARTSSSVPT